MRHTALLQNGKTCQLPLPNFVRFQQLALWACIGFAIGGLAWGISPEAWSLLVVFLLPFMWGHAPSRSAAALLMLGYYLAGGRGMPGGAVVFFGDSAPAWWGWALWMLSSLLLSTPYVALWTKNPSRKSSYFLLAVVLTAIPPFGLIGWCNPIAVAGVAFPGLRWIGVSLTLVLFALLVSRSRHWTLALVGLAVAANLLAAFFQEPKQPPGWAGQDTSFSRLAGAGANDAGQRLAALERIEWVKRYAGTVPPNSVRVLPETVLGPYDGIADFALQEVEETLQAQGSRLLVGAEMPQANGQYKNVLMVLGSKRGEDRVAVQGIPVPVSMWKPWAPDGAVANPFGHDNVVSVASRRVGAMVCYEQVLTHSFLWLMLQRPDVVVAVSNMWWARETSVSNIQSQMVSSFSRLFGTQVVTARNI